MTEPQDRTPGWKAYSEGLERWWTGSQWSETYRAAEGVTAPQSAYADMSRITKNRSGSYDVYVPSGDHVATVRTEGEAEAVLEEYREREARTRKPGSEGKPWSNPDSDPLADLADAAQRWRRPLTGPERVREAIRQDRGGEAPLTPQGFA